jgi:lipoyl(octanoyl) transferase
VLTPGDIPVVATNRGGQVTYHGPGQLVAYPLLDLHRRGTGIRELVTLLENAMIRTVAAYGITAFARAEAPGVYVEADHEMRKLGSIGLRVSRGCSYHGLSLNVAMDLEPFSRINPCGYAGLQMTQVSELGGPDQVDTVARDLESALVEVLT